VIPVEPHQVVVVILVKLDEIAMPEASATVGTDGRPGLLVRSRRDVFAALALRRTIAAGAFGTLQDHDVDALTGAGRHAPDAGLDARDLLEALLGEGDAAL